MTTLLAIDIGNTNTVAGLFDGDDLVYSFRFETNARHTEDEVGLVLTSLLERRGPSRSAVDAVAVASVVPALIRVYRAMSEAEFGKAALVVGPGVKTGMPILYDDPREVGADRIVNAVAGFEKVKDGVIIVDFGTATTFDCVSAKGEYLGGVIAPGVHASMDALAERTARLPRVEFARPPDVIGKSTVHSMQSGLVFGYVAMVDGLVERIQKRYPKRARVIATGGLARLIAAESTTIEEVDDRLTLDGLKLIWERNQ